MGCQTSKEVRQAAYLQDGPTEEEALPADICFLKLSDLEKHGRLPRRGWMPSFVHPVTREPNVNIAQPLASFSDQLVRVYVSMRWARPVDRYKLGAHPDVCGDPKADPPVASTAPGPAFELLVAACKLLLGTHVALQGGATPDLLLFLDYSCMDNDIDTTRERERLPEVMACCDLFLVSLLHDSLLSPGDEPPAEIPETDCWPTQEVLSRTFRDGHRRAILDTLATGPWRTHFADGWRRLEAMFAAVTPAVQADARAKLMRPGAARSALQAGRRAVLLYGSAEAAWSRPPALLPPMLHGLHEDPECLDRAGGFTDAKYDEDVGAPETGGFESSALREVATGLARGARDARVGLGYIGELSEAVEGRRGEAHGRGRYRTESGATYVGQFAHGEKHGVGRYTWSDGGVYEGQYVHDRRQGIGTKYYSAGGTYSGEWRDNRAHGQGVYVDANGDTYVGSYERGLRHGRGTFTFADGRVAHDGEWSAHKPAGEGAGSAAAAGRGRRKSIDLFFARRPSVVEADMAIAEGGDGGGGSPRAAGGMPAVARMGRRRSSATIVPELADMFKAKIGGKKG